MSYSEGLYREDVAADDTEAMLYKIRDLASIGVCATDSKMNVDVLPTLQSLFEVIHRSAGEAHDLLDEERHEREEAVGHPAKAKHTEFEHFLRTDPAVQKMIADAGLGRPLNEPNKPRSVD